MAELKATVCLQGKDIEVISSHIEFNRKTDNKGRPVTNVIGGRITITVESTRETTILEAMVNSPFKAISGKVIYYNLISATLLSSHDTQKSSDFS